MADLLIDAAIGLVLLALAGGALFSRSLLGSVMLFIAFGMALALAWVRLEAVDLALAEAAIGAGLTGVLLLRALAQESSHTSSRRLRRYGWFPAVIMVLALALLLFQTLPHLRRPPEQSESLATLVQQHIDASGVSHPVTAVLLNFRAWDTLLELVVLLLALLAIKQLRPIATSSLVTPWPLLIAWSKILAPLLLVVSGYLLWRGASGPGGAFQAGAVLAAGAVILRLNRLLPPLSWASWTIRSLVLAGAGIFMTIAVFTAWLGEGWLQYPVAHNGALILLIETAATVAVAITLTLLVVGDEKEMHS